MGRLSRAVAATLILVTGCEFSHVNPQAPVRITGRALDARGAPLSGAPVRLFKEADLSEALIGVVLAVGSLGAVCLLPGAPAICAKARTVMTAADGSYTFDLKGSDTQGLIGTVSTLDVVIAEPGGGERAATTTISFKARSTTVSLPDEGLWDAGPQLSEGSGRVLLGWTKLPGAYGSDVKYSVLFVDPARHGPLWSEAASGTGTQVDARVLEDVRSTVAAQARATLSAVNQDVRATYLSRSLDVAPIAGAPPSRHRPCLAVSAAPGGNGSGYGSGNGAGAALTASPQPVCRATDGDLVTPARLTGPAGQVVSGVVVDQGSGRPLSLVVARGLAGDFVVETSTDGAIYSQVGVGAASAAAISVPGRPTARYVRIRSPSGLDESLLSEISVW